MAKQDLTKHQQGIVRRYYEHHDTIHIGKLQELISELYLASPGKTADKLWKRAEQALAQTGANPAKAAAILQARNVQALAALVESLGKARP